MRYLYTDLISIEPAISPGIITFLTFFEQSEEVVMEHLVGRQLYQVGPFVIGPAEIADEIFADIALAWQDDSEYFFFSCSSHGVLILKCDCKDKQNK